MDRWAGRIREPEVALAWSSLEVDGTTRSHWATRESFVLVLDDGRTLDVELTSGDLELEPKSEHRGHFRDFSDRPEARRFGDAAPAPHRRALLRTAVARAGDRVTVFGEVVEHGFEGESALREPPARAPSRVRASRVSLGDPPRAPAGPRESRRPRPSIMGILALVGACVSASFSARAFLDAGEELSPRAPDGAIFALGLIAVALTLFRHVGHPPGFYFRDDPVDHRAAGHMVAFLAFCFAFLTAPMVVWDGLTVTARLVNNHLMVLGITGVTVAGCFASLIASQWNTARLTRLILGARPLEPGQRGRWGRLAGEVDDPTPVAGEGAAMIVTRELEWDDSGEHELEIEAEEYGGFLLHTEGGETIAVQAGKSTWATDVRRFRWGGIFGPEVPKDGRVEVSRELVPQGAAVVVAGRVSDGDPPRLKSSGPESLLLFATAPGGDALAALRRLHFRWWASIALMLAIGVAVAALHFGTVDRLPDGIFFIPGDD